MAHDVFLSYSHEDHTVANAAVATLESHGIRCWIAPRDILPGSDWGEAIIDAIEEARAMVLILSSHSNESEQIKREVERTVHQGLTVIPFRIEDVVPSKTLEYFISTQHWLDAMTPPLEDHLALLADTLTVLLAKKGGKEKPLHIGGEEPGPAPKERQPEVMSPEDQPRVITVSIPPGRFSLIITALVVVLLMAAGAAVYWRFAFPLAEPKVEKASQQQMAFPLPDKPSIAVMPFLNLTGEQNQDFFCDGLSESLIMALSKVPQLFVIARNSTFRYKGKGVKTKQVSEELGVQYVLEGSVQKAGDRVRITAQLIDALSGHQLWSERYDRSLKDIFDLQDEITMKILTELRVKITEGEAVRIQEKGTNNLQAYLKVVEAVGYRYQMNKEATAVAKRLAQEAVRLDPNYAQAHIALSFALMQEFVQGTSESPQETLSNAMKSAQRAIELDNSSADAQAALSQVFLLLRQHDKAIEIGERAVRLDPNSARAIFHLAQALNDSFRSAEAIPLLRQGIRLNPFFPQLYNQLGIAYRETGRYEEGIAAVKKTLQFAPNYSLAYITLATLYSYAGREDEARAAAAEVQRLDPNFSLIRYAKVTPWKEGPRRDRFMDALRQAGLK